MSVTQGTWYSGRSSMLSSDSWLIDIGERSHPNPMHRSSLFQCDFQNRRKVRVVFLLRGLTTMCQNGRSQLHMNSVVLVESQGSRALVRIVRLQKIDRRDNMIFTVHLGNRLIDENTPWGSPRSKLAYKKPTSTRKLRKSPVTSGRGSKHLDWTASRLGHVLFFLCYSSLFFHQTYAGARKKNKMPKEKKNTGSVSQTAWPTNDIPNLSCWAQLLGAVMLFFIFYQAMIELNSCQSPRKFDFSWYLTSLRGQRTCSNLQPKRSQHCECICLAEIAR